MPTRRQHRINEMLLEEISLLVPGQLDDPRLASVRITRVETARDMSTAKVYFTRLDEEQSVAETITALQHAAGPLSVELSGLGLRRMPRLVFAQDKDFESGQRVLWLLDHMGPAGRVGPAPGAAGREPGAANAPEPDEEDD